MAFSLPNPSVPTNGQLGDATPILQNELAIAQAIASFDGSQVQAGSIQSAALANSINPQVRGAETLSNFIFSGCIWSLVSGFSGTMTGGTIYVNGFRTIVSGVGSNTFAASSDTYIDIDNLGNIVYQAVANNASSPSLTANSIRVAKIITNGATITSVIQSGSDSIGTIIYPAGPANSVKMQNPYKFSVYLNTAENTGGSATSHVNLDTKSYDSGNNFNTTTHLFTAPIAGFYLFTGNVYFASPSGANYAVLINKNSGTIYQGNSQFVGAVSASLGMGKQLQLIAGDTIGLDFFNGNATPTPLNTGVTSTWFDGYLISAT